MLVLEESASLRLVTQNDHARFAAELVSLWRADGLPEAPWRATLLKATREHDNGWRGADAAPATSADTGWPCDFLDLPRSERQRIWRIGIERFISTEPRVAYLILLHAIRLYQGSLDSDGRVGFAGFLEDTRAELAQRCASEAETLEAAYEFLWLADALSLGACGALAQEAFSFGDYEIRARTGAVEVCPFPFAGGLTLSVPCRTIPKRQYTSVSDLGTVLAEARWASFPVSIKPPGARDTL